MQTKFKKKYEMSLEDTSATMAGSFPDEIQDMLIYAQHTHQNNGLNDNCKKCGHDLRHRIHFKIKGLYRVKYEYNNFEVRM